MNDWFIRFQIKHAKFLFVILLVSLFFLGLYGSNVKIDTDFNKLVPANSQSNTILRITDNTFDSNDAMIVIARLDRETIINDPISDMSDPRVSAYFDDLSDVMLQSQYITSVNGPIISEDKNYAKLVLNMYTPNSVGGFQDVKHEVEGLMTQVGKPKGIEVTLTGFPTLLDLVSRLLITDNLNTILITFVFIFIVLFWYSRDIYFIISTILVPISSLIMLSAVMVYFGVSISITLAAVGVLMLGLGIDYSIHIAVHYRKSRRDHEDHTLALIHSIKDLRIPIVASFVTTLAGFSALLLGVSPSSQNQGLVLSLGIIIVFINTFLVFPIVISVFQNRVKSKSNLSFRKIIDYLSKLAIYQARMLWTVIGVLFAMTLVMMYGASQVEFSTSNSNWIPAGNPISDSFRELNVAYGDVSSISVLLVSTEGDLRDVQTMRDVNIMVSKLEGIPNVDYVINPYSGISYDNSEVFEEITNNANTRSQFNKDYTLTQVIVRTENVDPDSAGNSKVLEEIEKIRDESTINHAKIYLAGDEVRFKELGETIQADAGLTTMISLVLVYLVACIIYASLSTGFMALLPIIIGVVWTVGFMGFFGVPFTTLSTGIISLVLGIGIDFSIHLVDSIKKAAKKVGLEEGIKESLSTSGSAILLSSITTISGFLALLFAQLLGTQRLGLSLAFSILAVFIVAITLVPALLAVTLKKEELGFTK